MIKAAVFYGWMGFKEHSSSKYGRGFAESLSEKSILKWKELLVRFLGKKLRIESNIFADTFDCNTEIICINPSKKKKKKKKKHNKIQVKFN